MTMATRKDTVEFMLATLNNPQRFSARAMFGEYALYVDDKTVALICDDQLYVKILPASADLEGLCEQGPPYPGAKPHYVITDEQITALTQLPAILLEVFAALPPKKKKPVKAKNRFL